MGALDDLILRPPDNPATPYNQGVRNVLHELFVQPVKQAGQALRGQMTEPEAQDFAFGAALGLIPMSRGIKAAKGIRAYHGSPHDFDRFDMSKIGTGEGAQAYGHGLYFADNEAVARQYRDQLTSMRVGAAKRMLGRHGGDVDSAIAGVRNEIDRLKNLPNAGNDPITRDRFIAIQEEKLAELNALKNSGSMSTGKMYEVNINAHPDKFIDWDAPLSKQPKLEQTMRRIGADPTGPGFEGPLTGAEGYRALQNKYFLDQIAGRGTNVRPQEVDAIASQAVGKMAQEGIPGIKYLDQGSRTAGEGSRNYVVFDDKLIDILRKYGLAGLMSGTAIGASRGPLEQLMVTE